MMRQKIFVWSILLVSSMGLAACGGGGGGGDGDTGGGGSFNSSSAATITDENAAEMSVGAAEGTKKSINSSVAPLGVVVSDREAVGALLEASADALREQASGPTLPMAITQDLSAQVCTGGGTYVFQSDDIGTQSANPSGSGTATYSNCNFDGTVIDGTALFEWADNFNHIDYTYDMTVSYGGQTYDVAGTMSCDFSASGGGCTYSENYVAGGRSYRVENIQVSGNNSSGYTVSARVVNSVYGYVDISATGITICANGNIGSGTVSVTDSSGNVVLTITFPDCDTMVATFDGVTQTAPQ